jgi:hypothetical protein
MSRFNFGDTYIGGEKINLDIVYRNLSQERQKLVINGDHSLWRKNNKGSVTLNGVKITSAELSLGKYSQLESKINKPVIQPPQPSAVQPPQASLAQPPQAPDTKTELNLDLSKGISITVNKEDIEIRPYSGIELKHVGVQNFKVINMAYSYGTARLRNIYIQGTRATQTYTISYKIFKNVICHQPDRLETLKIVFVGENLLLGDGCESHGEPEPKPEPIVPKLPVQDTIVPINTQPTYERLTMDLTKGIVVDVFEEKIFVQMYNGRKTKRAVIQNNRIFMPYSYTTAQLRKVSLKGCRETSTYTITVGNHVYDVCHEPNQMEGYTITFKGDNLLSEGDIKCGNEFPNEIPLNLTNGITLYVTNDKIEIKQYKDIEIPCTRILRNIKANLEAGDQMNFDGALIHMSHSYGTAHLNNIQVIGNRLTLSYKLLVKHWQQDIVREFDIVHEDDNKEEWTINYGGFNLLSGDVSEIHNEHEEKEMILPPLGSNTFYLDVLDGIKVAIENEELVVLQRKPLQSYGNINFVLSENNFKGFGMFNSVSLKGSIPERCFMITVGGRVFKVYHKAGVNMRFSIPLPGSKLLGGITFRGKREY